MPKVSVDISLCVGCGICEQFCPEVFEIQGDGLAHIKANNCSQHNLKELFGQCPVTAIQVA